MRGHLPLVAMRRRGFKPDCCWLTDLDVLELYRDWHLARNGTPWVLIEPGESLERLDLRFLVGLQVFVSIDDPERMRAVVEACRTAGAARAIGFATLPEGGKGADGLAMADTAGVYELHGGPF